MSAEKVRDYYAVLGVQRNATRRKIKRAAQKLKLKYRTDRENDQDGDDVDYRMEQYEKVMEASGVLQDRDERKLHDHNLFGAWDESLLNIQQRKAEASLRNLKLKIQDIRKREYNRTIPGTKAKGGGLIIREAWYGILNSPNVIDVNDGLTSLIETETHEAGSWLRTIRHEFESSSKLTTDHGFYDPAPPEELGSVQLHIKYSFNGIDHECTCRREEDVLIPSHKHQIDHPSCKSVIKLLKQQQLLTAKLQNFENEQFWQFLIHSLLPCGAVVFLFLRGRS